MYVRRVVTGFDAHGRSIVVADGSAPRTHEGELWLEVDRGPATHLRQGDIVVQNGTYHAWANRTDRPAVILACSMGTRPG